MSPRARLAGAILAPFAAVALGVLAAWPIYQTLWLLVPAAAGLLLGVGVAVLGRRRPGVLGSVLVLFALFALTVVPVAMPQVFDRLPAGLLRGLLDGLAAVALGWKQLLTLALPVGSYQTVLVPAYLVFLLSSFCAAALALRGGRFAPLAALPLTLPVAFGTVFGASAVSAPVRLGPLTVAAPREIGLWGAAMLLGALWVWFSAGAERRAALRRGRQAGDSVRGGGRPTRFAIGAATLLLALFSGVAIAPAFDGIRQVPRDRIDPEIVLRERASPLTAYRAWKRDDTIDAPLFEVSSDGALPERLRLAVLDSYDGVDFHIGATEAGRFTRFPSAPRVSEPATVEIVIAEGYSDIWVPLAELGSVPVFTGPRATLLSDGFYVNRDSGAAIAVPGGSDSEGLALGDGLRAIMQTAPAEVLAGRPLGEGPEIDLDAMPELDSWLKSQDQPATAEGLGELVQRLRDRGYLSHSISDAEGQRAWLDRLAVRYGTRFETSAGGHTLARIEQLFSQLNTQQRLAGDDAAPAMLVAGIGDDEQFATAAALIARALGFDSRVVLGVRLGDETAGVPGVPACSARCTGENIAAWVEVRGEEGDWAPLDATPQLALTPNTLEEGEQLPEFPTTPEERDAREVDPPLGLGERSDSADQPDEEETGSWLLPLLRVAGLALGALVLLLLPLLFLPLAKRRRAKKRRRETDPELRALGAWHEMVDRGADAGLPILVDASRSETAQLLATDAARWAAATTDRAVFSAAGISEAEAEWVWQAVDADTVERNAKLNRRQRLRARYSLRSYRVKGVWGRAKLGSGRSPARESSARSAVAAEAPAARRMPGRDKEST